MKAPLEGFETADPLLHIYTRLYQEIGHWERVKEELREECCGCTITLKEGSDRMIESHQ